MSVSTEGTHTYAMFLINVSVVESLVELKLKSPIVFVLFFVLGQVKILKLNVLYAVFVQCRDKPKKHSSKQAIL